MRRLPRRRSLYDPVRSAGGLHGVVRLRRGVAEFLRLPLILTAAMGAIGLVVALLDVRSGGRGPLRDLAEAVVPGNNAFDFVAEVASSVVTIGSITFSVLLLVLQQTASALTPAVFDQFLRRRSNQVYFGFFVGVSVFSFVVLAVTGPDAQPRYGAALALVLIVASLFVLLLLIHGAIDQMRPQAVVRSIHELALRARARELVVLGETRSVRESDPGDPERHIQLPDSGYVIKVDVAQLARVAAKAGPDVEVIVVATLGRYVVYGDVAARLVNVAPDDSSYDDAVRRAFLLDDVRDVTVESGYAIEQLANIVWAAASSAQHNPQTAAISVRSLYDLLARLLAGGERDRSDRALRQRELPVVYPDDAVRRVLAGLATSVISATESHQVQTCAESLLAFAGVVPRLRSSEDRTEFDRALASVLPSVIQHPELPALATALEELARALVEYGHDASQVTMVRTLLAAATRHLLSPADHDVAARRKRRSWPQGHDRHERG